MVEANRIHHIKLERSDDESRTPRVNISAIPNWLLAEGVLQPRGSRQRQGPMVTTCRTNRGGVGSRMRRRLAKFLPVFYFVVLAQILAPISGALLAAKAFANPSFDAAICATHIVSDAGSSDQGTPSGGHDQDACAALCLSSAMGTALTVDPFLANFAIVPPSQPVAWSVRKDRFVPETRLSLAQARAPPVLS